MPRTLEEVVKAREALLNTRNAVREVIDHDLASILRDFGVNSTTIYASSVPTMQRLTVMYLAEGDLVKEIAKLELAIDERNSPPPSLSATSRDVEGEWG